MDCEENKKEFITIFNNAVKRPGADKFLEWLSKSDFFYAPASSKFHNAFEGGLCEHSINVCKRLKMLVEQEKKLHAANDAVTVITDESIVICGLLHDVCKANFYKVSTAIRRKTTSGKRCLISL